MTSTRWVRATMAVGALASMMLAAAPSGASASASSSSAASASSAASSSSSSRPVVVPVRVLDGQGTALGARPTVEVRVGKAKPVPVLLDTGSSGLRLFDTAFSTGPGSGVQVTAKRSVITYAGGHRFTGVVAKAVVTMGSSATSGPVAFTDVERAHCIPAKPSCPAAGGMAGFEAAGEFGILGIGTQRGGGVTSPILGMPGRRGQRWSLHLVGGSGSLILGAALPAPKKATAIPMARIPSVSEPSLWADSRLPLCVGVGGADQCGRGLFDSGTYTMQISGPGFAPVAVVTGTNHVSGGLPVSVGMPGARKPFWTFTSGATKSKNLVTVVARRGAFVNTGVQAFYAFTITYDDSTGRIWLST
jgi:hypothetical protein